MFGKFSATAIIVFFLKFDRITICCLPSIILISLLLPVVIIARLEFRKASRHKLLYFLKNISDSRLLGKSPTYLGQRFLADLHLEERQAVFLALIDQVTHFSYDICTQPHLLILVDLCYYELQYSLTQNDQ